MYVIEEVTTNKKLCMHLSRSVWKSLPAPIEKVSFFASKSDEHYIIAVFDLYEEAVAVLKQIKNNKMYKIPFEIKSKIFESFGCIIADLEKSEIKNPNVQIKHESLSSTSS